MRIVTAALAALLCVATVALAAEAPKQPITLPNGAGAVTFRHASHAALGCEICHPGGSGKVKLAKDEAHGLCKACHERGQGPAKCNECHDTKRK